MTRQTYSDFGIGEVCEKTGITAKQLRYWEEKKYISAPERIVCGDRAYRRYNDEHIKLLREIRRNLLRGYSLEGAVRNARENMETGGADDGNQ